MKIDDVKYVRVLLTNRCNLSCIFCHREGCDYNSKDIDKNILLDTIKNLYNIGYRKVKLMGGEPMLYKKLESVICAIKSIGDDIDLSMISNGSAPTIKYMKTFELGLNRLNFSVHGWEYEYFKKNTGASIDIWKVIRKNIVWLAKEKRISKLNYVLKKGEKENDFFKLIEFAKDYNLIIDALNLILTPDCKAMGNLQYEFEEIEKLIQEKYVIVESYEFNNIYSLPSKRIVLDNGVIINLKTNKLREQRIFSSCNECLYKNECIEGIKAIRITNNALIQPCLLRTDNVLNLKSVACEKEIIEYLRNL